MESIAIVGRMTRGLALVRQPTAPAELAAGARRAIAVSMRR